MGFGFFSRKLQISFMLFLKIAKTLRKLVSRLRDNLDLVLLITLLFLRFSVSIGRVSELD